MAITNATTLAEYASGIGTQGATLTVDATNKRVGVGTTNPQATLQVGTGVTVWGNSGIVSATKFYGDGSNITNAGSTLSAGSGDQRVVITSLTSGTMTSAATDADLSWNSTSNTLSAANVTASGTVTGGSFAGDGSGLTGVASTDWIITGTAATFGSTVQVTDATDSTSTATGALRVTGGIGIGKSVYIGQDLVVAGNITGLGTFITEDVTNQDVLGLSTFRAGVQVGPTNGIGVTIQSGGAVFAGIVTATSYRGDGGSLTGISAGITTEDNTQSNGIVTINLAKDDHKFTATGICTVTPTGSGTEGGSGTLRITNSGITTVGFSTHFLWPAGAAPSLPTAAGSISLVSYTIQRNGSAGIATQLLSGASANFS